MQELINLNSFVLFLNFVVNIGLGLFIYFRDEKRDEVSRAFVSILFAVAFWTLGFLLFFQKVSSFELVYYRRIALAGAVLIVGFFAYFTLIFPKTKESSPLYRKIIILLPSYVFSFITLFSNLIVNRVEVVNPDFLSIDFGKMVYGSGFSFIFIYFLAYAVFSFYNLFTKYVEAEGAVKLQIFYVLFGSLLAAVLAVLTNFVLPYFWGISMCASFSPVFGLVFASFVIYAIAKHRLLNIEFFLSRGVLVLVGILLLVGLASNFATGNTILFLPYYAILADLGLGAFVYLRGRNSRVNQVFFSLSVSLAAWAFFVLMARLSPEGVRLLFWNKMVFASAAFIPVFALYFVIYFPYTLDKFSKPFKWLTGIFGATIAFVALFSEQIVKGVYINQGEPRLILGPFFLFCAAYFVGFMGWIFIIAAQKRAVSQGLYRLQIGYLFLGSILTTLLAMITNLIFPLLGYTQFRSLGPSFTIIFILFATYAIIKHRLMSIEIVIQRSSVYAVAMILVTALYIAAVMGSELLLRSITGYSSLMVTAMVALVIALLYQPLIQIFQKLSSLIFFRGRYDYQNTLRRLSHEIASIIRLSELTRLVVTFFIDVMKVSEISFLALEKDGEHFVSAPLSAARYKKIEIDVSSPVITWLSEEKDMLIYEEVEERINFHEGMRKEGERLKNRLVVIRDEMGRLGISAWMPIISKDKLIGIIALGSKLSGDIFTSEDVALLNTLGNQTAVALDNAILYDEVLSMKNYSEEILQSMTDGIITTDNEARLVTYNYMAEHITGRKAGDVIGKKCEEVWGERGAITQAVEKTLKGECCNNFEVGIPSKERGLVPVSFSSIVLRGRKGEKNGVLLSIQDLSEFKELERKVRRADKLSALATMAAGMAHEIKNPLSSLKIFSQLLPKKFNDPEYRKKLEEILPREINRIHRIVESLLAFARATAPNFEKAKLRDLLEESLKLNERQAENAGIKIIKSYADELPEIEADRSQLTQAFSNLILNAIQAMPDGGELTIESFSGKKEEEQLKEVKVKISNTGAPIPEETQKKLFDPFFTTRHEGTGLGLTITHSIIDGHKGFINLESMPEKGTSFTISLPVSQGLV